MFLCITVYLCEIILTSTMQMKLPDAVHYFYLPSDKALYTSLNRQSHRWNIESLDIISQPVIICWVITPATSCKVSRVHGCHGCIGWVCIYVEMCWNVNAVQQSLSYCQPANLWLCESPNLTLLKLMESLKDTRFRQFIY